MKSLSLYRVRADVGGSNALFSQAVVFAHDPTEAIEIVRRECAKDWEDQCPEGAWGPIAPRAQLTAELVEPALGPVLGSSER
jgi:hypothetical protein